MGLMTSYLQAPPLSADAAKDACDPAARTALFKAASSDPGAPILFVCPDGASDTLVMGPTLQTLADTCRVTVVAWEWPEHGRRRPRGQGEVAADKWRPMTAPLSAVKADVVAAYGEVAKLAAEAGAPIYLLARGFGCGPALHLLAQDGVDVKRVCLLGAFTSLLDLAWVRRPLTLAWPVIWWRQPRGDETFDNLAAAALIKKRADGGPPILLVHGRWDSFSPWEQAARLKQALGDTATLRVRPDWGHHTHWAEAIEGEVRRWACD